MESLALLVPLPVGVGMKTLRILPFLVLGSAALLVAATGTKSDPGFERFTVRRGQTASYIAFQKYGAFNDSISALILQDNPEVTNLDMLKVGQVLRLRVPAAPPQKAARSAPKKTIDLASRRAVVTMVTGQGTVRRADGSVEPLRANQFISKGDAVTTGADGYAELVIDNQSVLRLNHSTEIRMSGIQEPRAATSRDTRPFVTKIALLRGKTWTQVQKWAGGIVNYQIQLPTAIAGVHGTVFETEVQSDSSGAVGVIEGEVGVGGGASSADAPRTSLAPKAVSGPQEVSMEEWTRLVKTGMRLSVPRSGQPGDPIPWTPKPEEWAGLEDQRECVCD